MKTATVAKFETDYSLITHPNTELKIVGDFLKDIARNNRQIKP